MRGQWMATRADDSAGGAPEDTHGHHLGPESSQSLCALLGRITGNGLDVELGGRGGIGQDGFDDGTALFAGGPEHDNGLFGHDYGRRSRAMKDTFQRVEDSHMIGGKGSGKCKID